jgi:hypothetical protein
LAENFVLAHGLILTKSNISEQALNVTPFFFGFIINIIFTFLAIFVV